MRNTFTMETYNRWQREAAPPEVTVTPEVQTPDGIRLTTLELAPIHAERYLEVRAAKLASGPDYRGCGCKSAHDSGINSIAYGAKRRKTSRDSGDERG